jgi:hypothetical protein
MQQTTHLSILDAIVDLQNRGYFFDFCLIGEKLFCTQQKQFFRPEEVDILEMHCFFHEEGLWQETVVCGIEALPSGAKGILMHKRRPHASGARQHGSEKVADGLCTDKKGIVPINTGSRRKQTLL